MKRYFLAILFCLLLCFSVYADVDTIEGTALSSIDTIEGSTGYDTIEGSSAGGAAQSCSASSYHSYTNSDENDYIYVGYNNTYYYSGQAVYQGGAASLCRAIFTCYNYTGDIDNANYTFVAQVWSMTGDNLNAQIGGNSDTVTGDTITAACDGDGLVTFSWSADYPTMANGYAIVVIRTDTTDEGNYWKLAQDSSGGPATEYAAMWDNGGTRQSAQIDIEYDLYKLE